jgi:histidinol-phosphate/aromatic aminotransferase/cobyric acid decarboxylase-like protein
MLFNAKAIATPMKKFAHDLDAMLAAVTPETRMVIICNPNNPTGTITPRADIEWLVANKPEGSVILLDEAYIHISNEPYGTDLVARDKDVIILRTFSKLYGMAGLRAGAALGRPDLLARIKTYRAGALPVTAMVGAKASLLSKDLVPQRRKIIGDIRSDVFAWLDKHNYEYVPSVSNKFMLNVHRPGREIVQAMADRHVYIGRVWPSWPTHVRVSIGTREEMAKFEAALAQVMA